MARLRALGQALVTAAYFAAALRDLHLVMLTLLRGCFFAMVEGLVASGPSIRWDKGGGGFLRSLARAFYRICLLMISPPLRVFAHGAGLDGLPRGTARPLRSMDCGTIGRRRSVLA